MKFEYDGDGYPTEKTLRAVRDYSGSLLEFFQALQPIWWGGDGGVRKTTGKDLIGRRVVRFRIHTWGWSGNESIIYAMEKNWLLWTFSWLESRRGGHYLFEFRRDMKIPPRKKKQKFIQPKETLPARDVL